MNTRLHTPGSSGSTTLVLLSYDERDALERLLPRIPFQLFDRVLALDGGSTDGTLALYEARGIETVVQKARGRGNAFIEAMNLVTTDRVVFFSTDGNEDPGDLPRMLAHLEEGYDLVIAGRFVRPGSCSDNSDDPLRIRRFGSMAYSLLVRLVWGPDVWDSCNGYRGFRVASMRAMGLDAPLHEIEIQSTIRAAKLKMRIKEFPTRELPRLAGTFKPTARTATLAWRTGLYFARELMPGAAWRLS